MIEQRRQAGWGTDRDEDRKGWETIVCQARVE